MNAPFKTPETEAPLWDLTDLYGSRDDARVAADLARSRVLVDELNGLRGRLAAERADAQALGAVLDRAITVYEQASDILGALGAYAFLAASTARDDAGAQGFEADVREKITAIATPTVWLTLEINQIDDAELEAALAAHDGAARWRPWLRRVRAMKPHELSAELETFIAERGPITAQWPRLFDEQLAALRAKAGHDSLTLAEALNRLSDAKPARRKAAAEGALDSLLVIVIALHYHPYRLPESASQDFNRHDITYYSADATTYQSAHAGASDNSDSEEAGMATSK